MGLVLGRRIKESVIIGDDVVVTVVRIGPGSIRFLIEAPPEVRIVRAEIEDDPGRDRARERP